MRSTNSAFFLVDKDGYLRKSVKSQLGIKLLKLCPQIDKKGPETTPKAHAIIIDFMAFVRKIPIKKLHPPIKTFHDFAIALTSMVTKAGHNCDEIHIVFDSYREDSIKNGKRERRGKSKDRVVLDVVSPNQHLPVVIENFWSSPISKTAFQAFYVDWLKTNYHGSKTLYLGISPHAWIVSAGRALLFPRLNCTHEETDDRMMFHVQDILSHRTGPTSLTLLSGDTDVFVCLLYHITVNWRDFGPNELTSRHQRIGLPIRVPAKGCHNRCWQKASLNNYHYYYYYYYCERRVIVQCTVIPFIYLFCVCSGFSGDVSQAFSLYLSFSFSLSGLF